MMSLVFDDDLFDAWILRRREPPTINPEPWKGPRIVDTEDPYLVEPDYKNGASILGHILGRCTKPCGTPAKARWHYRHGEPLDEACRLAFNAARRARYVKKSEVIVP